MRLIHFKCIIFVAKFMLKFLFFSFWFCIIKNNNNNKPAAHCPPYPTCHLGCMLLCHPSYMLLKYMSPHPYERHAQKQ